MSWCLLVPNDKQTYSKLQLPHHIFFILTHWGRVTHICVSKLTTISSDNGLSPGRRQAIIWTNAGKLLIGRLGTNFSDNLIGIQTFSFKKMPLKMSSAKWRPFCLGLNVLRYDDNNVCTSNRVDVIFVLNVGQYLTKYHLHRATPPGPLLHDRD